MQADARRLQIKGNEVIARDAAELAAREESLLGRGPNLQAWREHFDRRKQAHYREMVRARNAAARWRAAARAVRP